MHAARSAAVLLAILAASGCIAPYSRVGGSAHRKLFRGTLSDVDRAVEQALLGNRFTIRNHEQGVGGSSFVAATPEGGTRKVHVSPEEDGLVEVTVGSEAEWREAVRIQERVAEVLGVSPFRRMP